MKLGTRLLLLLLPTVVGIMAVYTILAMRTREQSLARDARLETRAYARALAVAFNHAVREVSREDVQAILNQVSEVPTVYGIVVYDGRGVPLYASDSLRNPGSAPSAALQEVLTSGGETTYGRTIDGRPVFSVLRAIQAGRPGRSAATGALEVAQPLAFIEAELGAVRRRYLLTTATLLLAITFVTLWLVRRTVTRPLGELVGASLALGSGDLSYRLDPRRTPGELRQLADAFNHMAGGLARTQAAVVRETDERLGLERRLRETEKMAAMGSLAAGVAHEIAAPLNVISGRAEMLLRRAADGAQERQLRIIIQQINRITMIVRNLLDFARRRDVRREPTDVAAVLTGVNELLEEELARAGVELDFEAPDSCWVAGDVDLLHQVFVNLCLNAVQAMVVVEGEQRLTVRGRVIVGEAGRATRVAVEVRDTGPGIAPEMLDRIFDPFVTTKTRGTGLGLVVARSIVQEHGGELVARNAPGGGGAVFEVRLPAVDARHPTAPAPAVQGGPAHA